MYFPLCNYTALVMCPTETLLGISFEQLSEQGRQPPMLLESTAHESVCPPIAASLAAQTVVPLKAIEHIRPMRGGSQSHLMRCSDGNYYVVKFQGNPQGTRILVNELLGTRIAARLGLPTAVSQIVLVSEELIRYSKAMVFEFARGRTPCAPGLCFGSRYTVDPRKTPVNDILPCSLFCDLTNPSDFLGMFVFDKWTCNTDGRQVVFFRQPPNSLFRAVMIDQGFCFNSAEWNFPDAPLRSLYRKYPSYEHVYGLDSFEPWLTRLETEINADVLSEFARDVPPEWYASDSASMQSLLERLNRRRSKVRDLLLQAYQTSPQIFPNWVARGAARGTKNHDYPDQAISPIATKKLISDAHRKSVAG